MNGNDEKRNERNEGHGLNEKKSEKSEENEMHLLKNLSEIFDEKMARKKEKKKVNLKQK